MRSLIPGPSLRVSREKRLIGAMLQNYCRGHRLPQFWPWGRPGQGGPQRRLGYTGARLARRGRRRNCGSTSDGIAEATAMNELRFIRGKRTGLEKSGRACPICCWVNYSVQIGDTACSPACCTMRSGFGDTSTLGQPSLEEPSTLPSTRGKNRCVARLAARRQYTHVVEPRERFEPSPSDANPWSFTSRFRASIASPAV